MSIASHSSGVTGVDGATPHFCRHTGIRCPHQSCRLMHQSRFSPSHSRYVFPHTAPERTCLAAGDGVDRHAAQARPAVVVVAHADEPLVREVRLDRRLRAVAVAHFSGMTRSSFPSNRPSARHRSSTTASRAFVAIEALVLGGDVVDRAVGVQDVDDADLGMPLIAGVVVRIVGRRHLDAAGTKRAQCPRAGRRR